MGFMGMCQAKSTIIVLLHPDTKNYNLALKVYKSSIGRGFTGFLTILKRPA